MTAFDFTDVVSIKGSSAALTILVHKELLVLTFAFVTTAGLLLTI
ncbi:hypothetical protein [Clostridium sp. CH2]|nr:hypothetical protein [Clostridium sp. CH2]